MPEYRVKLYRGVYAAVRSVNGRTERTSLGTTDAADARRRLIDLTTPKTGDTVADLVAVYLADKDQTAIRSADLHGSWKNAKEHFGHLRADQITRDICRAYTRKRRSEGRRDGTIRKELECVRAAVNFNKKGAGAVFELPPKPEPKDRYLTKNEARRLSRAARRFPHVRAFIVLSLCTAARSSALLELTWDRVDLGRGVAALKLGDNLDDQRKNRARVPLNSRAIRYLKVLKAAAESDHVIEWAGVKVGSIKKGFAAAVKRSSLEDITPHTLRHTAASWMAEDDVPILEISKLLGHGDTRITERTYAHLRPSYLQNAAKSLDW
jgi:integrase